MNSSLTAEMAVLLMCLTSLFGVLVIGAGAFLLYRYFATLVRTPPPMGRDEFLAHAGTSLLPWRRDAFDDLAAHVRCNMRRVNLLGYAQGVVKSLRRPDADGWLAFHIERSQATAAQVTLRTSEKQIVLDIQLEKILPQTGEAQVTLDGQPFGRIRLPECTFFDTDDHLAGHYRRRAVSLRVRSKPYYGPVVVGERTIAELTDVWINLPPQFKGRFYLSFTPLPEPWPALRNVRPDMTPREENWLLAILALELFYDFCWIRRSW